MELAAVGLVAAQEGRVDDRPAARHPALLVRHLPDGGRPDRRGPGRVVALARPGWLRGSSAAARGPRRAPRRARAEMRRDAPCAWPGDVVQQLQRDRRRHARPSTALQSRSGRQRLVLERDLLDERRRPRCPRPLAPRPKLWRAPRSSSSRRPTMRLVGLAARRAAGRRRPARGARLRARRATTLWRVPHWPHLTWSPWWYESGTRMSARQCTHRPLTGFCHPSSVGREDNTVRRPGIQE